MIRQQVLIAIVTHRERTLNINDDVFPRESFISFTTGVYALHWRSHCRSSVLCTYFALPAPLSTILHHLRPIGGCKDKVERLGRRTMILRKTSVKLVEQPAPPSDLRSGCRNRGVRHIGKPNNALVQHDTRLQDSIFR